MLLLAGVLGCIEYGVEGEPTVSSPVLTTPTTVTTPTPTTTTTAPPDEVCNGVDDDGDGLVDEGSVDFDADGVADCVDDECPVELLDGGTVARDCSAWAGAVVDPWTLSVRWQWSSTAGRASGGVTSPLVVQLDDDDGDGLLTDADDPEVVFLHQEDTDARLIVLDAVTGTVLEDLAGWYYGAQPAVADVDGDGAPELLVHEYISGALVALDGGLRELWTSADLTPAYIGGMPTVAVGDLDGDGLVEVVGEALVLDGATGTTLAALATGSSFVSLSAPTLLVDVEPDGVQEVVYGGAVYEASGTRRWSNGGTGTFAWPVPLQADADPEAELLFAGDGGVVLHDTDGAVLATLASFAQEVGPPCVADFDGDGAVEVAVPRQVSLDLYDLVDGLVWSVPVADVSAAAGCLAVDLDEDGTPEVIYADEHELLVVDGCTGTVEARWADHDSGTLVETPTVADVDRDGHVEILLVSNGSSGVRGLTVLGNDGWPAGPLSWSRLHQVGGVSDAVGGDPSRGTWWTTDEALRAAPPTASPPSAGARLLAGDDCAAGCDPASPVLHALRLENLTDLAVPASQTLALYAVDGGDLTFLRTVPLGVDVPPGTVSASVVIEASVAELGATGLAVVIEPAVPGDDDPADDVARFGAWCR